MTRPPILITSASLDAHSFEPVCEQITTLGYPSVIYQTDRVINRSDRFEVIIDDSGTLAINYNGTAISPQDIGAAWYRKLANYNHEESGNDLAKQLYLNNELRHYHDTIWQLYPENAWLNPPQAIRNADQKNRTTDTCSLIRF